MSLVEISWIQCAQYDDAKDYQSVVYLHEWHGRAFYWGVVDKSKFGGNRQKIDEDGHLNPRYGSSYKHWIEGCLRNGAKLYIGEVKEVIGISLFDIEKQLISEFPSDMNGEESSLNLKISHSGDIPMAIRSELIRLGAKL